MKISSAIPTVCTILLIHQYNSNNMLFSNGSFLDNTIRLPMHTRCCTLFISVVQPSKIVKWWDCTSLLRRRYAAIQPCSMFSLKFIITWFLIVLPPPPLNFQFPSTVHCWILCLASLEILFWVLLLTSLLTISKLYDLPPPPLQSCTFLARSLFLFIPTCEGIH